jgi:methyl halide transferase
MLNKNYWETRYQNNQTGWDAGEITTPLKDYFDQLTNKLLQILIPGAGNAYEAEYLHKNNFTNVTVLDLASQPLANIKTRIADFPEPNLIQGDFFEHYQKYDLIIEQTFFCALNPEMRSNYAKQMHALLNKNGKLVGVLFNTQFEGGPPFGGNSDEYRKYFEPYFEFLKFEICTNSIKPRSNKELFIMLQKK